MKNLVVAASSALRRGECVGNMKETKRSKRSDLSEYAAHIIVEQSDLCDLLMRRLVEFAQAIENALHLRSVVVRLLLALRKNVREYATRHVLDENRLLRCVMRQLQLSRLINSRVLYALLLRVRALERLYQTMDFESDEYDDKLVKYLQLRSDINTAIKLRDNMRAIARHYANITNTHEAVRFLRELAAQLETIT